MKKRFIVMVRKPSPHVRVEGEIPPDMLFDILMRVPTRSFRSIRSVCKLWRSTARDPTFVRNHFDRAASVSEHGHRRPLVVALLRNGQGKKGGSLISFSPYDAAISNGKLSLNQVKTIALPTHIEHHLSSSCNGLLMLYNTYGGFVIVNPITGERPKVSRPSLHHSQSSACSPKCSMGFEPHSNKYKIVRIYCARIFPPITYNMEVHTLGTEPWKQLCSMAEMPDTVATVNGVMYWGINKTRKILAVDLSTEDVSTIPLPRHDGDFLLGELQGYLSCTYKKLTDRSVVVWLRKPKDDMSYEWRYQFWIPILAAGNWGDAPGGKPKWAAPLAIYEGRFILLKTATCLGFFDLRMGRFRILYRNEAMDEVQLHVDSVLSAEDRPPVCPAVRSIRIGWDSIFKYKKEFFIFCVFFFSNLLVAFFTMFYAFEH